MHLFAAQHRLADGQRPRSRQQSYSGSKPQSREGLNSAKALSNCLKQLLSAYFE
jgi:hypothetical protein